MNKTKLLVLDIDNTIFDWVQYYIPAFEQQLRFVSNLTNIPYETLCSESKEVFEEHHSIEYPFVVQQLPSILSYYNNDINKMLNECVEPARQQFKAYAKLKPYKGVATTLQALKEKDIKIVALTDAPRYISMWRLQHLELLHYFDAIYGLQDPKLPILNNQPVVTNDILIKHLNRKSFGFLGKIRILPDEYEKPSVKGMKMILIDYEMDEKKDRKHVIYVGDNLKKDIKLADALDITSVWFKPGTNVDASLYTTMQEFAPGKFIYRNVSEQATETPKPDHIVNDFSEILNIIV